MDNEYKRLVNAVSAIVNGDSTWMEKKELVIREVDDTGTEADFEEFIGWFDQMCPPVGDSN